MYKQNYKNVCQQQATYVDQHNYITLTNTEACCNGVIPFMTALSDNSL